MRALIQRVSSASVNVEGQVVGRIGKGLLVLLGVMKGDTEQDLAYLLKKIPALRIFADPEGKMNLSVTDIGGEVLVISQFTLAARTRKGNRPSFDDAEAPARARKTYEEFVTRLSSLGITVKTGTFGEYMAVSLVNDGPVTILVDSSDPA